MSKNMNAAPAFPDIKDTTPDGWANLASGLTVPESVAPAFPSINETTSHGWSELGSGLIVPESAAKGGAENGMMTRDERITDGQEKFNALKTRAQEGLSKMMQGLKDRFYIGISRGAELPGQIATGAEMVRETIAQKSTEAREVVGQKSSDAKEAILQKGVETKEAISNAWGAARGKAAELFEKGNDVILQNVKVARERRAARMERRQKARDQRTAELDTRQAVRDTRRAARETQENIRLRQSTADTVRNSNDKASIRKERLENIGTTLESMMLRKDLRRAEETEKDAHQQAEQIAQEAEEARLKAEANPGDVGLQLVAEEKKGLEITAKAQSMRAANETIRLQAAMSRLEEESRRAQYSIDISRERIEERRGRAEARRAARMAARKEALGDTWESAKDRVARLANTDPNKIKQFGVKVAKAAGRLTKATASRLVPAS